MLSKRWRSTNTGDEHFQVCNFKILAFLNLQHCQASKLSEETYGKQYFETYDLFFVGQNVG